jgi:hypothetical protein
MGGMGGVINVALVLQGGAVIAREVKTPQPNSALKFLGYLYRNCSKSHAAAVRKRLDRYLSALSCKQSCDAEKEHV